MNTIYILIGFLIVVAAVRTYLADSYLDRALKEIVERSEKLIDNYTLEKGYSSTQLEIYRLFALLNMRDSFDIMLFDVRRWKYRAFFPVGWLDK